MGGGGDRVTLEGGLEEEVDRNKAGGRERVEKGEGEEGGVMSQRLMSWDFSLHATTTTLRESQLKISVMHVYKYYIL